MTPRLHTIAQGLAVVRDRRIPVGTEKGRLITESFRETEGQQTIIRSAKAFAHLVEHAPIFISDGELIVGNPASKPWGVEMTPLWGTWPDEEIASLERDGYVVGAKEKDEIRRLNEYWKRRTLTSRMAELYDDQVLWPYAQLGVVLPAFRSKEEGWGPGGLLGGGYGIHHEISNMLGTPDFALPIRRGLRAMIAEAERELADTRLFSTAAVRKADFLRAVIIALGGVVRLAERFSDLAAAMAMRESSPERRAELEKIAAICAHVPAEPARTLHEALQAYWFVYLAVLPSGTVGMGRLDQLFIDYYTADLAAGRITEAAAVELFACLRLRSMNVIRGGGSVHRKKWAGGSKWHNAVIGGQLESGADATNALSYLILDAALECPTPHHSLTMRVHEGTPKTLMRKALDVVKTGLGMPAFIGDPAHISFLTERGIPLEEARDYNIAGCMSVSVTGASRVVAGPMFLTPRVLKFALKGYQENAGVFAPRTPPLEEHGSFESFMESFKQHLAYYCRCQAEFNNVTIRSIGDRFPRPIESALLSDGVAAGRDIYDRTLRFDNANFVNPIGVVNVADSLAAIRELVFERGVVGARELRDEIDRNWTGARGAEIRQLCLAVPKYGNDDDRADDLAAEVYAAIAEAVAPLTTTTGGLCLPSALTIGTSAWPGGVASGATPDGRFADDPLAEESLTPMRGRETSGPWAVIASALKVDQTQYQMIELDLRFSRRALSDPLSIDNLEALIRHYLAQGGKHIQFNVYERSDLQQAIEQPDTHPNLIIRLGGTSAYFADLSPDLQLEIIARSQFDAMPVRAAAGS